MATAQDPSSGASPDAVKSFKLDVSSTAVEQIKGLMKDQKPDMAVRVFVQVGGGGGCCGGSAPLYGMAFDKAKNGDNVITVGGIHFIVDPYSADFLNGANVDFVTLGEESGFKVTNPNMPVNEAGGCNSCGTGEESGGSCGCGSGGCGG